MINKKFVAVIFVLFFIAIAVVYIFQVSDKLGNVLFLIAPLTAVIASWYAVRTYRLNNGQGQVMALLSAGLICWFIGETLFFLYQFVWHHTPFPSKADVFYLIGYPLIFAGLVKEILIHKVNLHDFNKLFMTLVILLLAVLAVIVAYFGVGKAYTPGTSFLSNGISIAYGIADFLLIVPCLFVLKIALDYQGGKLYTSWILILLALLFMLTGDILFAVFRNKYDTLVWPYTLIDLAYVLSYLSFAFSFFYTSATIRELHAKLRI